ncbi:MAG TPA: alpha/beta fold hydrolase [Burkholderiales bacterium]|nr:alpha/beta fold hydrolase [Burkholderiales bacterium]
MSGTAVEFPARDGFRLAGTMFRPAAPNRRAVLVQAATGVRQEFYGKFAAYLAARGMSVLTFDYRGIGRSRPPSLRGFRARMLDWADKDMAGALDYLARATQGARIIGVGHSFGGQVFGLVPGNERYVAAMTVGAQSGYWKHWPGAGKAGMWFLTHVLLPGVSRLNGYFPARLFGQGEDLPSGVAAEWARWCRHPEYVVGALDAHEAFARFTAPMRLYAVSDDSYAPPAAVEAFMAFYPGAPKKLERLEVATLGGGPVGHFGFFRDRFADSLWRSAADWLVAR